MLFFLIPGFCFAQQPIIQAQQFIANQSYQKAEQIIINYLQLNPASMQALELYGDAVGHQKKWDEAIEIYKKLVNQQPNSANYQYKYGGVLAMKALSVNKLKALNYVGDAKTAFLKAAELDKNHIDTRWALVEMYMQLPGIIGGSTKKSLQYANELEAISKVDGYLAKGYIYEYSSEPELAEKYYKMAVKIGGSLNCYDKLSNFYEQQNQPEKAVATLQASIDKHQRNALHYQLGKVCAEYNLNLDQGAQCLQKYINLHTAKDGVPVAWANYRLAQIYKHKGEIPKALEYIDLAISELPDIKPFKEEKLIIQQLLQ